MKDPWRKKPIIIAVVFALVLVGFIFLFSKVYMRRAEIWNKQLVDLTYTYDYAVILMPDGSIVKGKVQSWIDFEDGDQIQVRIDGKTYLTHSMNVVLISN